MVFIFSYLNIETNNIKYLVNHYFYHNISIINFLPISIANNLDKKLNIFDIRIKSMYLSINL